VDEIKIQDFQRDYPGENFPEYRTLSDEEAFRIQLTIITKLGLPQTTSPLDIVKSLEKTSILVPNCNAEDADFELITILTELGINTESTVYINWFRFDKIDELRLVDVSKYLDDLWYPVADSIDVFDESLSWILSIGYFGELLLIKFS